MPANTTQIERRLCAAPDSLRANSKLRSQEYSTPILGLIFLAHGDYRFVQAESRLGARVRGLGLEPVEVTDQTQEAVA
ncbi:hypothetical protein [Deinococcus marmoris]|uniref:hypothetical protein n=1 Tax=Deinococcus marmoris TaxID=249408 RepID=UPI00049773F6|nr:hypothetical protein [Deinococcus marmoris]